MQMVDPLFADASTFNFSLQEASPAIDNAISIVGVKDDFLEVTRDIKPDLGALEFVPEPVLSIEEFQIDETQFFPNPAFGTVHFLRKGAINDFYIYSIEGKDVTKQTSFDEQGNLRVEKLSRGLYILKINGFSKKLMLK